MDELKEFKRKELEEIFAKNDWRINFADKMKGLAEDYDSETKKTIIWIAVDLAKAGKIEEAMFIAEYYQYDLDPDINSEVNKKIEEGKDVHYITTVRGTLPHLLSSILANLNTDYYPRVLKIIDKLILTE